MEGIAKLKFMLSPNGLIGKNLYIARPDIYSTIDLDSVIAYASKAAGISQSDMLVTLEALIDAFSYYVCNGHSFKIDGVGTFSLSLNTTAADLYAASPVTGADAVNKIGINFRPDTQIKNMLSNLSLKVEAVNPNRLAEFTEIVLSRVQFSTRNTTLASKDVDAFVYAHAGNSMKLGGYNLKNGLVAVITGLNGESEVSESVNLNGATRSCTTVSGKITKTYTQITKLVVKDGENEIASYNFTGANSGATPYYGSTLITENGRYAYSGNAISVRGEVGEVVVMLDGVKLNPTSTTEKRLDFADVILEIGSHTITVGEKSYTFEVTDAEHASISKLSANGVTVNYGSTSPVREGQTYTFVATGANTNLVQASDIVVPTGATMTEFSANEHQVTFKVTFGSDGGQLKVANYMCVVEISQSTVEITSAPVANGGTLTASQNQRINIGGTQLQNVEVYCNGTKVDIQDKTGTSFHFNAINAGNYVFYSDSTKQESIYSFKVEFNGNAFL